MTKKNKKRTNFKKGFQKNIVKIAGTILFLLAGFGFFGADITHIFNSTLNELDSAVNGKPTNKAPYTSSEKAKGSSSKKKDNLKYDQVGGNDNKYTTDKEDTHVPKQAEGIYEQGKSIFTTEELTFSDDILNGKDVWIQYGELDTSVNNLIPDWQVQGRATQMNAVVSQKTMRTGTKANPNIKPTGWISGASPVKHARGHLLGNVLGGSGDDERNLVTIYQNPVNTPYMTEYELAIRDAVDNGDVVRYQVTPIFDNDVEPLFPREIQMQGKSLTKGGTIDFKVVIPNEK